ncbi:MAG: hypothetical protein ACLGHQ_04935 [Acidimicrobiia bacterium]
MTASKTTASKTTARKAPAKKAAGKKKQQVSRWHDGTTPLDELGPCEQLAHQIVGDFGDLTPSVERIMTAELDDAQRLTALTSFHESLGRVGDPNRDPRVAIVNAAG